MDREFAALMAFIFLCLALVIGGVTWAAIASQGNQEVHAGVVVDKGHQAAYTTQSCILVGKVMVCDPVNHPESWGISVQGRDSSGDTAIRYVQIPEGQYLEIDIGDNVTIDDNGAVRIER